MAIKATDLMIGDLVYIHEPECKGHRIDSIDELDGQVGADGEVYDECDIRPIPLTEYILAKNGFRYSMSHDDWTNINCNFFLHEGGNGYRVQNTDIKLDYVHQLQHLLLLCGIEKELVID